MVLPLRESVWHGDEVAVDVIGRMSTERYWLTRRENGNGEIEIGKGKLEIGRAERVAI
jgi:hypothetical protein